MIREISLQIIVVPDFKLLSLNLTQGTMNNFILHIWFSVRDPNFVPPQYVEAAVIKSLYLRITKTEISFQWKPCSQ
jgi:hypothetical protein